VRPPHAKDVAPDEMPAPGAPMADVEQAQG